ncbi:MAG: hypothetical protein E7556_03120 [Ruminococcaceae bacterium]|nr:hypothetical protein [Oscillospiraceae bacterium]
MKLTPAMKIILAVAAICIAITLITTNNIATVMVLHGLNTTPAVATQGSNTQQGTVDNSNQGGGYVDNSASVNTNTNTSTGTDANTSTSTDTNNNTATTPSGNTSNTGNAGNTGNTGNTNNGGNAGSNDAGASAGKNDKASVVAEFNKAINSVKTSAKEVKQLNVTNYLGGTPTIPGALNSIYGMLGGDDWLDGMLQDNSQGEATYAGADIKAKFPVEGEDYASKLTAEDVAKAERSEANGVVTITIETVPDAKSDSVKHGDGHAPKAFNVILPGIVNDNIPGIATSLVGTATMEYPASTIVVKIDKATGNVISADYDLKWTINFDKLGAIIPLATKASYTVTY